MDEHEKIYDGMRPPEQYEQGTPDIPRPPQTGKGMSPLTWLLGYGLGMAHQVYDPLFGPKLPTNDMAARDAAIRAQYGKAEKDVTLSDFLPGAWRSVKDVASRLWHGEPKAWGGATVVAAPFAAKGAAVAAQAIDRQVVNTARALAEQAHAGTLPAPIDKLLVTQGGLYHGTGDPVGLAVTGPGKLNVRRIADEMSQAHLRTTPRELTAMTHAGSTPDFGYGPTVFNIKLDPAAYEQRLNLGDPKMLRQTAKDIAYMAEQIKGASSRELLPSYAYLSEEQVTAADKVLKRYPVVDARGLSKSLSRVQREVAKSMGSRELDWLHSLTPAEGERQVAITQPRAVRKMTGHVVNDYMVEERPQDLTSGRKTIEREYLPFVEADVEGGMTRRLKLKMPKTIKGAFASKLQEQIKGLHERLTTEAEKLGFQKTKEGVYERPPQPPEPETVIPGTSNRPRRIPRHLMSEGLKKELTEWLTDTYSPHVGPTMLEDEY